MCLWLAITADDASTGSARLYHASSPLFLRVRCSVQPAVHSTRLAVPVATKLSLHNLNIQPRCRVVAPAAPREQFASTRDGKAVGAIHALQSNTPPVHRVNTGQRIGCAPLRGFPARLSSSNVCIPQLTATTRTTPFPATAGLYRGLLVARLPPSPN